MKPDPVLARITRALVAKGCHTVILYGSRARGDFTAESDYDVIDVSSRARSVTRIARQVAGRYWDVFIHPERFLKKVDASLLKLHGGKILLEKRRFGTGLLARIRRLHDKGPAKLAAWDAELKRTWHHKTFERSRRRFSATRAADRDPRGLFRASSALVPRVEGEPRVAERS